MAGYIAYIVLIAILGVVIYQDFRFRAVSWVVFPVLLAAALALGLGQTGSAELLESSIINLGVLALMFAGLTIYFSIRERALVNIVNRYIGIADILLLAVIAVLFSPVNFIMYYMGSLVLITVGSLIYLVLKKDVNAEIPLAGAFAITLAACLVFNGVNGAVSLYDDALALELLNPFLFTT
jgi:Flp pilus assembly protein protease CpaA